MEFLAEASFKSTESRENLVVPSGAQLRPTPVTVSGVSVVSSIWVLSTFLIIIALAFSAGWPNWLSNHDPDQLGPLTTVHVGLFYVCYELQGEPDPGVYCNTDFATTSGKACCSPHLDFAAPTNLNRTEGSVRLYEAEAKDIAYLVSASAIYCVAVLLLIGSLVFGIIAYCKPRVCKGKCSMFAVAFVLQVFACTLLLLALVMFPVSFESDFVQQFCGDRASYYYRGQCDLEWPLFTAMIVTSLSFYLPSLAIFSMNIADGYQAPICC